MRTDVYSLWAYWQDRPETAEACAHRFARMLAHLAEIDPVFVQWRKKAQSRAAANEPFCQMPPEIEELTRIFDQERHYRYVPPVVWPEMGFTFGTWNGIDPPHAISLNASVGVYDTNSSPNHIELSISERRLATDRPWMGSELKPVMLAVIEAWEADDAVIFSNRYRDFTPRDDSGRLCLFPRVGWLNYLATPRSSQVTIPEGIRAEYLPDGGLLTTLCEEPFTIDNPRHMELAAAMQQAMRPIQR